MKRVTDGKNIAVVGYDSTLKYFGGAPMAAPAFLGWCKELGYTADLYTFNGSGYTSDTCISMIWGAPYVPKPWAEFAAILNTYDMVYFSSPMSIGYKRKEQEFFVEKYRELTVPFVIHVHGEYDKRYYNMDMVREILEMGPCHGIVVVRKGYWDTPETFGDSPSYEFYPCTLPRYTMREDTEWPPSPNGISPEQKKNLLYAHRFASVKRPHHLAELTHSQEFLDAVGKVEAWGPTTGMFNMWERDQKFIQIAQWKRVNRYFNTFAWSHLSWLEHYRFFWDVSGSSRTRYEMNRLDLAGVEAVMAGCAPLVAKQFIPEDLKDICIPVDIDNTCDRSFLGVIEVINDNYVDYLEFIKPVLLDSKYSYEAVKDNVRQIIEGGTG